MKFRGGGNYAPLLGRFAEKTNGIEDLAAFEIDVEVHATFGELTEAGTQAHRASPAAYLRKRDCLVINDAAFSELADPTRLAVLAHEIGHAHRHRRGISVPGGEDCFEADVLAIRWGMGEALFADRERTYGDKYAAILRGVLREPHHDLLVAYRLWQMRRNAGIT